MERYFGLKPLKEEPSRYFRRHFYWGFIYDRIGMRLRYKIGVDKIMWGNDFPHSAGDWPNSRRVIDDICAGLPEDEKKRILGRVAAKNSFLFVFWQSRANIVDHPPRIRPIAGRVREVVPPHDLVDTNLIAQTHSDAVVNESPVKMPAKISARLFLERLQSKIALHPVLRRIF